jgi:hypothetical protein
VAQQLCDHAQGLVGQILVDERVPAGLGPQPRQTVAFPDALCLSAVQFCENNVKNSRDSFDENCKPLVFSNLHGTSGGTKYLSIAPTPGVDNSHFPIRIGLVDGRKGLTS